METEDGWVGLGVVGHRLANIASDFDPRTYGFRKLSDLVRKTAACRRIEGSCDQATEPNLTRHPHTPLVIVAQSPYTVPNR